ncbi:hypothetical protein ACFV0G_24740, partial [Kitasatospora sp. NPDC059571]
GPPPAGRGAGSAAGGGRRAAPPARAGGGPGPPPAPGLVQAGPTACAAQTAGFLQPLLAGEGVSAQDRPAAVDPGDHSRPAWQLCGALGPLVKS